MALPLLWALLLFVLIPQITYPLAVLCINLPDFGYTALVSGALAVLWCLMWAGLNWVGWRRHAVSATPSERAATVNA